MGPFNMPWLTFTAFIGVGASIVASILWAVNEIRHDRNIDR